MGKIRMIPSTDLRGIATIRDIKRIQFYTALSRRHLIALITL